MSLFSQASNIVTPINIRTINIETVIISLKFYKKEIAQ